MAKGRTMPITSNKIIEDSQQVDGRRWVTEGQPVDEEGTGGEFYTPYEFKWTYSMKDPLATIW